GRYKKLISSVHQIKITNLIQQEPFPHVCARIQGLEVELLLDTCSSLNVLNSETARKLNLPIKKECTDISIEGIGSTITLPHKTITAEVHIGKINKTYEIQFTIIPDIKVNLLSWSWIKEQGQEIWNTILDKQQELNKTHEQPEKKLDIDVVVYHTKSSDPVLRKTLIQKKGPEEKLNSGEEYQNTPKEHHTRTRTKGQKTEILTHKPIGKKLLQKENPEEQMNSGAVVQITPKEHQIRTMIPGQMTKINTHKPIEEKLHQTERPEESLNLGAEFQNTPIEHQIRNMIKGQMTKINTQEPIRNTVYDLTLTSTKPIYLKGYPVPAHYEEVVDAQIKELLEQNIIEKGSRGDYISPGFIIGKKNGKHRLVVDYSSLNKITEEEGSIFPDVYQLLREIPPNQKLFTQIDLKHGYHQVLVAKSSRKYTGFTIRNQHYIYKRMPFGLKGAPAFFQRTIFDKIGDLPFVKIFLDDILIFSQTLEEHLQHIQLVLNRLAEHNIQLNFEKSHFLQRRVTYLGNILTEKGMQADTQKIAELRKEPPPKTARGIMKLLGIFNWFRPYIPNLSQTVQPLTEKLKGGKRQDIKNKPISWTEEDEKVRQKIFDAIEKQLIIANPDPKEPFQLYTDACDKGIGAILTQGNTLIGIFSKSLNPAQKNYTIMEKELLAVISALQYFRILILGRKIYLHTDNKNILARKPLDSSRSERWKIMTLEYDMEMRHIAGDK
ncbi:hypothetical protein NEAUS07_2627, partial [Nematocida ausubeli]